MSDMDRARNLIVESLHAIVDAGMFLKMHARAASDPQERAEVLGEVAGLAEAGRRLEAILERSAEITEAMAS